jgi:hypothetical protein
LRIIIIHLRFLDEKHSLNDLLRSCGEDFDTDTTADQSDGLNNLGSKLSICWLHIFIQAAQKKIDGLSEMSVKFGFHYDSGGCESCHGILFLDRNTSFHETS